MLIPLGRRRLHLSIDHIPSDLPKSAGSTLIPAETDAELAHPVAGRRAIRERAEQDISRILYAGPPLR